MMFVGIAVGGVIPAAAVVVVGRDFDERFGKGEVIFIRRLCRIEVEVKFLELRLRNDFRQEGLELLRHRTGMDHAVIGQPFAEIAVETRFRPAVMEPDARELCRAVFRRDQFGKVQNFVNIKLDIRRIAVRIPSVADIFAYPAVEIELCTAHVRILRDIRKVGYPRVVGGIRNRGLRRVAFFRVFKKAFVKINVGRPAPHLDFPEEKPVRRVSGEDFISGMTFPAFGLFRVFLRIEAAVPLVGTVAVGTGRITRRRVVDNGLAAVGCGGGRGLRAFRDGHAVHRRNCGDRLIGGTFRKIVEQVGENVRIVGGAVVETGVTAACDRSFRRTCIRRDSFRTGDLPVKVDGIVHGGQFDGRIGEVRLFIHPRFRAAEVPEIVVPVTGGRRSVVNDLPTVCKEGIHLKGSSSVIFG